MKKNNFLKIFLICFLGLIVAVSATFFGMRGDLLSNNHESNLNSLAFEQGVNELNALENAEGLTVACSTVSDLQKAVSKNVFSSERGDEKISDLSFEIVQKELKRNEYNIYQVEGGYEIYPEFSLKTLIVDDDLAHDYSAEKVVSGYKKYKVLSFDSIEKTKLAFEALTSDGKNVWENQIISACSSSTTDDDYSSYKTWGASLMDVNGINSYINSNEECSSKEVVVAVLDTGINTSHELFENRFLTDSDGNYVGYSYYTTSYKYSGYSFEDDNSHGTHVSGIIADLTPDNVKILPIKIMNSAGKGEGAKIIAALEQVLTYKKDYNICAVNMSFGGAYSGASTYTNYFDSLRANGILPIVAAGNESTDTAGCDPAKCDNAIVVSSLKKTSTNECLFDAEYSNYGDEVDISAPGTAIKSAGISGTNSASASTYVAKSGTSMATPHVSAGVALLALVHSSSSVDDIETELYNLAVDMGTPGKDIYYGNGVLNLRFFDVEFSSQAITIKDGTLDISNNEVFEFDKSKNLIFATTDASYEIYYSLNAIPKSSTDKKFEDQYLANASNKIYYYAVKKSGEKITARTKIFSLILQFNSNDATDYFEINSEGRITAYTGQFSILTVPDTINGIEVKAIGDDVFKYSELVSLTLPSSCKIISEYAFYDCFKLKYLNAPGVTTALKCAFYGCTALKVVSSESPGSSTEGFYLPSLSLIGNNAFTLCNNLQTVSLSSATVIGSDVFVYCSSLSSCYLPNVVTLKPYSFYGCSNITSFYIGAKVVTLDGAFALSGLKSITFSSSNTNFYYDGKGLYSEGELKLVALSDYDSYEVKNSYETTSGTVNVTSISEYAFPREGTRLNKLVLPENLQTAEGNIFNGYINYLHIKSTSLNNSGYYIDSTYTEPIVAEVSVLELGENVSSVPIAFMDAYSIEYYVINSRSTEIVSSIAPKGLKLTGLYLNFSQSVDGDYLQTLKEKGVLSTSHIYSKAQLPSNYTSYYSSLGYIEKNGDYYVYSQYSNGYFISIEIDGEGEVFPANLFYVSNGGDLNLFFKTGDNHYFAGIFKGENNLIPTSDLETVEAGGYVTITGITKSTTLKFAFYKDNSYAYTVNYWKESLSGGTLVDGLYYDFDHSLTLRAVAGETVTVTPNYSMGLGFTAPDGQTFKMPSNNSTVINFYYNRNYYNLTLEHGTGIDSVSGAGTYKFGQSINISAVVSEDYAFENWKADVSLFTPPTSQSAKITMPAFNVKLTASAKLNVCYITFDEYFGGSVSPAPTSNIYKATLNSNLTFTFTPDSNHFVRDVIVDGESKGAVTKYTFTSLSQDHTVKVDFGSLYSYTVKHWKECLTETDKVVDGLYYELDTMESFSGKENDYTIATAKTYDGFKSISFSQRKLVSEGIVINIYYARRSYDLTLYSGSGILKIEGAGSYKYGAQVNISAQLITGYEWSEWSSENSAFGSLQDASTTITMPAYDLILTAKANKIIFEITFEPYNHGTISPHPAGYKYSVYYLANVKFEFSPNKGYYIKDVVIDGESKGAVTSWSFTDIDSDHTVGVQFEKGSCSVVVKTSANGSLTADKSLDNIDFGETLTFTITPKEGFSVKKVLVDGEEVSFSDNKFSLVVYTQNINVEVVYVEILSNDEDDPEPKEEKTEEKKTITIAGHEFSIIEIVAYAGSAMLVLVLLILTIVVSKKSKSNGGRRRDTFE